MIRTALLLFSLLSCVANVASAANGVEIVSAEFGLFLDGRKNELVFEPTDVIPRKEGQRYGWIIEVKTKKRSLAVREEYLLPELEANKPKDEIGRNLHIPDLRRSQVSQRQLVPVDGQIFGEWAIGAGEPPGKRRLQVMIEGELGASFEYEVK